MPHESIQQIKKPATETSVAGKKMRELFEMIALESVNYQV
jgi:hypothetical protein